MKLTAFAAAAWVAGIAALDAGAASISEPSTVFYGQVWGVDSARPFLLTEGELNWTIHRADGAELTLLEHLFPLKQGEFSYRLNVPHSALASGLDRPSATVPLGLVDETHTHFEITINGMRARILGPNGPLFDAAQARRTMVYRLDLEVDLAAVDSDGNGIPDWWEEKYGQDNTTADLDDDGWNTLAEFLNGGNPDQDNRIPSLETKEVQAYAGGTAGVKLHAIDADSSASDLSYTLTALPSVGTLQLRNGTPGTPGSDRELQIGDSFSQMEVDEGKLVFVHPVEGMSARTASFEVSLQDEDPAHPASVGAVVVNIYRPGIHVAQPELDAAAESLPQQLPQLPEFLGFERQKVANYILSRHFGYIIWDCAQAARDLELSVPSSGLSPEAYEADYLPQYGPDRSQLLQGGLGQDHLQGGMGDDILIGGRGNDILKGFGGADVYIISSPADGNDVLEDFSLGDNDAIDISQVLSGTSHTLADYVQITSDGTDSLMGISASGKGTDYTDIMLTVRGLELAQADLYDLVETGNLRPGGKLLPPRISIIAMVAEASENGPINGVLALQRMGDASEAITVNLQITGSAQNGVDYRHLNSQVAMAAGQRMVLLTISPYADAVTEMSEIVEVAVNTGTGYTVGTADRAEVSIEDLMPQISIEVLDPVAVQSTMTPGVMLIVRNGAMDRNLLVRLDISGSATAGSDYESIPTYVNLPAFQSFALLEVRPKATAVFQNGFETVQLAVRPDASYKVMPPARSRIFIVPEHLSFAEWRERHFPGYSGSILAFAQADSGQLGIPHVFRYAFGLNAANPQESTGRPSFRLREGHLLVDFRQPASVADVQYVVEVSTDLLHWQNGMEFVEPVEVADDSSAADTVCYRAKRSLSDLPRQYMRVRVVYAP